MSKKKRKQLQSPAQNPVYEDPFRFYKCIFASAFLILIVAVIYYPSLKVPFLLDDYGKITRNPDIKSLNNIPSRLIYPHETPPRKHRNDPSRPLTYLTLTVDYHFNQLNPSGYHITNILIHGTVVLLVFVLASFIFSLFEIRNIGPPFFTSLLFAVHPINVNVVTYVIGRAASLATVFYLLALIFYIHYRRGTNWGILGSIICYVLALSSNQLAITLPAIVFLADFCLFSNGSLNQLKKNWKHHGVYWLVFGIYLGMRISYFGKLGDVEASLIIVTQKEYFLTQLVAIWKYIGFLFAPAGLSFEHLFGPFKTIANLKVCLALISYLILFGTLFAGFKKDKKIGSFLIFGILWFLITISPTSSFFPTTASLAENRVYLPSIGLYLIIFYSLQLLIQKYKSGRFFLIMFWSISIMGATYLSSSTYNRNKMYQSPSQIWIDVSKKYPAHYRAHQNLSTEYFRQGNFKGMVEEAKKAVALNEEALDVRSNLAMGYYNLRLYKKAIITYQIILEKNPDYATAHANIGLAYEQLNNREAAIKAYQNAIRLNPMLIEPLNNLGNIYVETGRLHEAKIMYEAALRIDPHNATILKNYKRIANIKSNP